MTQATNLQEEKVKFSGEFYCSVKMHDGNPCGRRGEDKIEGKCFFHCGRLQQGEQSQKRFKVELEAYIKDVATNPNLRYYDFTEFHFSVVPFANKVFQKPVFFVNSNFESKANFAEAEFQKEAEFYESKFQEEADFVGAKFKSEVSFQFGEFQNLAYFSFAEFEKEANFVRVKFKGKAFFEETEFISKPVFFGATFFKEVDFTFANFETEVFFHATEFHGLVNFNSVTFKRDLRFKVYEVNDDTCFRWECNFRNLKVGKDATLTFEKVNLSKASFLDTNIESIVFRDVEWHRPTKIWIRRKQALWDEFRPLKKDEKHDFEKIAENYRQLVLNYERKRDYETAEDFHIGEMEVRRKKKGSNIKKPLNTKLRQVFNAYSLYWFLSNYGTSYIRAILVLILFVGIFSVFSLYAGFQPIEKKDTSLYGVIDYNVCPDARHPQVSFKQWSKDYGESVLLTLSIMTFQRERFYEPEEEFFSRFWLSASVIVLTGQVALVLLAIRRRFKR